MEAFETLTDAINSLRKRGYTHDFILRETNIECTELDESFPPDSFEVIEMHRFEGMSSAGDSSILFAVETHSGHKGTFVDAYGAYSVSLSPEMMKKLHFKKY